MKQQNPKNSSGRSGANRGAMGNTQRTGYTSRPQSGTQRTGYTSRPQSGTQRTGYTSRPQSGTQRTGYGASRPSNTAPQPSSSRSPEGYRTASRRIGERTGSQPEEQLTPAEQHRRSRRQRGSGCAGTIVYVIAVLGISIVLSLLAIFAANDVFAFVKDDAVVTLDIKENTKLSSLAKQLDENGVINYRAVFQLYLALKHDDQTVMPGSYVLNPSMDYGQIINTLIYADSKETTQITIPEGFSTMQIKQVLMENYVCTSEAFDETANTYPFKHEFLKEHLPPSERWLEGYLFPDTYEIYKGNGAMVDTLNKMLNTFDDKFTPEMRDQAAAMGRSIHEIVTIASLVEREAKVPEEFPRIAGVIYNRLNNAAEYPYLQIDAAVLYGLGRTEGKLSEQDLQTDTPYNLYTRQGLPQGPICSPGMRSLEAALQPEAHGYYYYVAMPDGSHLFATTLAEHEANIATSDAAQAAAAAQPAE